jgi:hypothetical protein
VNVAVIFILITLSSNESKRLFFTGFTPGHTDDKNDNGASYHLVNLSWSSILYLFIIISKYTSGIGYDKDDDDDLNQ